MSENFLNLSLFVRVVLDTLGESGAEALCDAVNYFGCWEDQLLLYTVLLVFDAEGLNFTKEAFCALHGKRRDFQEVKNG